MQVSDRNIQSRMSSLTGSGAGYDTIDVAACTKASIQVSNVKEAVDDPTADTTLFLLLGAIRMYNPHILSLRAGGWEASPMGKDPQGMTLGILGMGGIGKAVAKRAHAIGMSVIYHNRSQSSDADPSIAYVSFDKLLETSDALALCLPLNVGHTVFASHWC
jgi:glyoxylate reductase